MPIRQHALSVMLATGAASLVTSAAHSVQDGACETQSTAAPTITHDDLDPVVFFAELVERYRRMTAYQDTVNVVQVIEDGGAEPSRVESNLACSLDQDGKLAVSTPMSDYTSVLGSVLPIRTSDAMAAAQHERAVWLAPHMSLRFDQSPLQRSSRSPLKPVEARTVTVEDQTVVQLRLSNRDEAEAGGVDGLVPPCMNRETPELTFDLYVNADSMLVERIEGDETLPDGRQQKTTLHIQPLHSASPDDETGRWTDVADDVEVTPPSNDANAAPPAFDQTPPPDATSSIE